MERAKEREGRKEGEDGGARAACPPSFCPSSPLSLRFLSVFFFLFLSSSSSNLDTMHTIHAHIRSICTRVTWGTLERLGARHAREEGGEGDDERRGEMSRTKVSGQERDTGP